MLKEKDILSSKIGIIANDAGGANYIKAFIDYHSLTPYVFAKGIASKIFNSIKDAKKCHSVEEIISNSELLLFGTGWESDFEIKALLSAKKHITTITFLDHWTNYMERFTYKKKVILPDYIVVYDKYAFQIAKINFPNSQKILFFENYYILNQISEARTYKKKEEYILFIDEPLKDWNNNYNPGAKYNYDEYTGFQYFLNYIEHSKFSSEKILIRLHPSEANRDKYMFITKNFANISISTNNSLIQDIINSKFVVGFESTALVIGLELNKIVYNIIPPNCTKTSLPHKEIKFFYNEN